MSAESYMDALSASVSATSVIISIIISIICLIGLWKMFEKAGKPGWACIVPFYNAYCLFDIAFGTGWLFLLLFIPCVNFIIEIILMFKLAKAYGKGVGFGFGLLFLNPIFVLILGFGDAEYVGA